MGTDFKVEVVECSERELITRWQAHASSWIIRAKSDISAGKRQAAMSVFIPSRISQLVDEKDSRQKIFDMYGAASVLKMLGELRRAKDLLLELAGIVSYVGIYVEMSNICTEASEFLEAVKYLETAHQKWPESPVVWSRLASSLLRVNQNERALRLLRKTVEKIPDNQILYTSFLHSSHICEEYDCLEMFKDHKRWAKYNASKDLAIDGHKNVVDPDRKLRIGYISPDFRIHPVGLMIKPIIDNQNKNEVELFGYANVAGKDNLTSYFEKKFDHYRDIHNVSDDDVVAKIVSDKIDILIDLAGHTINNRLGVMAYKPAPIQATYLGYFDTTVKALIIRTVTLLSGCIVILLKSLIK